MVKELESEPKRIEWFRRRFGGPKSGSSREFVQSVNRIYYETWAGNYRERITDDIESEYADLDRAVQNITDPETVIVDVGGGTGFEFRTANRLSWSWKHFLLLEPSSEMAKEAENTVNGSQQSVSVVEGDIDSLSTLDLPEGRRLYWINSAVHHVVWFDEFFGTIGRLMGPGDLLLIGHEPRNEYAKSPWFAAFAGVSVLRKFWSLVAHRADVQTSDLWAKAISRMEREEVTVAGISPLAVRRIVDYGVGVKRDVARLGLPPEENEGFWTLDDVLFYLRRPSRVRYVSTYRHFGDSGRSRILRMANRAAKTVAPRSGSQFFALIEAVSSPASA